MVARFLLNRSRPTSLGLSSTPNLPPIPDPNWNFVTNQKEPNKANHSERAAIFYSSAAFVSLIGLADSIYLTVEHLSGRSVRCTIVTGCSEVLSSSYASVRGVPLAMIGAAAYFTVFSLAVLAAYSYKWAAKFLV